MCAEKLSQFICDYAYDKYILKHSSKHDEGSNLSKKQCARSWLDNASIRIIQLKASTHAAKFINGGSRCSSYFKITDPLDGYMSTGYVELHEVDITGNSAIFDVAKMMMTIVEGKSLLGCLEHNDASALEILAENPLQLKNWIEGFSSVWKVDFPTSHKLAKQIYFPVADDYHLLCPLFATSLTQAMHEKLIAARFGEEAKAIREAHRAKKWHPQPDVRYPNLALMHFGGTKPQNISALNSSRGGRAWLLPCLPPTWMNLQRAPQNRRSIFAPRGEFNHAASGIIASMTFLLKSNVEHNNIRIRSARVQYVDELIDLLFMQASAFQQEKWQGWSQHCPEMPLHQQLWLDPWRSKADEAFHLERDKDDWQAGVADDFARWLNYRLKKASLDVGAVEHKAWRTLPLFRRRMREMDAIVQEALK